jgi:hypothetical protein
MQRKGLLSLTFLSVTDDYMLVPDVPFRKSLLHMVSLSSFFVLHCLHYHLFFTARLLSVIDVSCIIRACVWLMCQVLVSEDQMVPEGGWPAGKHKQKEKEKSKLRFGVEEEPEEEVMEGVARMLQDAGELPASQPVCHAARPSSCL